MQKKYHTRYKPFVTTTTIVIHLINAFYNEVQVSPHKKLLIIPHCKLHTVKVGRHVGLGFKDTYQHWCIIPPLLNFPLLEYKHTVS